MELVTIRGWTLAHVQGEPRRIQDLELAKRLGYSRPRDIRKLITKMIETGQLHDVLDLGPARRSVAPNSGPERNPAFAAKTEEHEYWLTRNQALKVAARSETPPADALLDEMIQVFELAIDGKLQAQPQQLSPLEMWRMALESAEAQERKTAALAVRQDATEKRIELLEAEEEKRQVQAEGHQYFSVLAWAKRNKLKLDASRGAQLGRRARMICEGYGWPIGSVPDARYGQVGTYPLEALDAAWQGMSK